MHASGVCGFSSMNCRTSGGMSSEINDLGRRSELEEYIEGLLEEEEAV